MGAMALFGGRSYLKLAPRGIKKAEAQKEAWHRL
jgi:uncharacterized protein YeaO (DUF488 family)